MEELLRKVSRGEPLGKAALGQAVNGYLDGTVSREEMTSFLRAVCAHGLSDRDAIALTEVMLESGETLAFKPRQYPYADKHSTGGLADSTTLIVAPIVAEAGIPFLKMSGRKLGHTGGTLDKLECFEGLRTERTVEEAERIVDEVGAAVIAQSKELVPADKALYKLRDETDTVKSLPLIASSVVSKKLASGAEVFVLDVKTGAGAFMESRAEGRKLARLMVKILSDAGKRAAAVLSDMNSPLGEGVGGVMEVIDALEVLEGKESRLQALAILLAGKLISLAKGTVDEVGQREAMAILRSGRATERLKRMIRAEGGALDLFDKAKRQEILSADAGTVLAKKSGYLKKIDCVTLGMTARAFEEAGGYGFIVPFKVGDRVEKSAPLVRLYGKSPAPAEIIRTLEGCFEITAEKRDRDPLVYEIIT